MSLEMAEKTILNIFAPFEESEIASKIEFAENMYLYFSSLTKYFSEDNGFSKNDSAVIADFINELSRAYLPKSALRIKLDSINTRILTPDELIKDYNSKKNYVPDTLISAQALVTLLKGMVT